jgi:hypothetical protein
MTPDPLGTEVPTPDELVAMCEGAGYRVTAAAAQIVTAERPIAGEPELFRAVVFHRAAEDPRWNAGCVLRRRTAPLTFDHKALGQRVVVATLIDAEFWLGGVSSIPASARETAALSAPR